MSCSRSQVHKHLTESERLRALVPANVELAHFGGIRGRDCWKHVAGVVILGRNLPPAEDAERIALALRAHRDVPLPPTGGEYEHAAVRWRAKDGRGGVTRDWRHPDPLIEAIRWSICDAETMQAADRARLVWPDGPKWVVLFNSTPTLAADELIPLERWLGLAADPLARFGKALVRDKGAVVLSGKRLAERHPDLFQTPGAARVAVHRVTKDPPAEVPTGIAGVSVPVGIMRGKGPPDRPGPETPVLTTLPGQPTAVAVSRQVEACVWVKDSAGRRHHVIRAEAGHFDLGAGAAHFVVPDMPTKAED